ncbi:Crp/Fnr family transcriptional regulator [Roseivivax sediminis]|uniref:cAMP-binding domain of CRP or a regulatory subunit of cAMP-dependent protein kinases n=1 Tax=Roseivivax sediminis TaxID=936889 RepID=A0A1I1W032_9RHOB|nr:Crp/Fnr family transcriptional regulator [Roseivivax sediminis]SFD88562.1 cAMP-binding domain of CRP or a regulatory subunit of cAMP-dependent protein kinases [Roseivivax sediminis]
MNDTTTPTSQLLSLVLGRRATLDSDEIAALAQLPVRSRRFSHGDTIIPQGPAPEESCLVVSGMALRVQPTTSERGIVSAVQIPGDFVDLHALVLDYLDHSVVAQGECKVQLVPKEALQELTRNHPHLTRLLWMTTLIDAKIHRAWLAAGATLRAKERIAHFLCELYVRYDIIGFVENGSFEMPLDQKDLERIFGLSKAHANRAVQELRGQSLIDWHRHRVVIHDFERLSTLARFDPSYLEVAQLGRQSAPSISSQPLSATTDASR